jgi:hypothetical protein
MLTKLWLEKLKESDQTEDVDVDVDVGIILEWISEKYCGKM